MADRLDVPKFTLLPVSQAQETRVLTNNLPAYKVGENAPVAQMQNVMSADVNRDRFVESIKASSQMLVKNITGTQVKTIDLASVTAGSTSGVLGKKPISMPYTSLRDDRVIPKQNYSKIDESLVNIFGHKGPDEQKNDGGGDIGWGVLPGDGEGHICECYEPHCYDYECPNRVDWVDWSDYEDPGEEFGVEPW